METFDFMPKADDIERFRIKLGETRFWWIEYDQPFEQIFCDSAHLAAAWEADFGVPWLGFELHHHPVRRETDREDVWLIEYGMPVGKMAVAHEWMKGWMELVRANQIHGCYHEAGLKEGRVYKF